MGRPNRNCDRYETQMVELACRFVYQESRERCVCCPWVSQEAFRLRGIIVFESCGLFCAIH